MLSVGAVEAGGKANSIFPDLFIVMAVVEYSTAELHVLLFRLCPSW